MQETLQNQNLKVNVHFLTRVEGHGDIIVDVQNGALKECKFKVIETPRFFETMLRGRLVHEAQHLMSRICGICACGHSLASLKAAERAIGIEPHEDTIMLRKLLLYQELMDSHILHAYVLAAPDLLGVPSILPLMKTHTKVVERAFRMKKVSITACEILAGRHTHPISFVLGGVTKIPHKGDMKKLHRLMLEARADYDETLALFKSLEFPDFERKTRFVALSSPDEYALYDGEINLNGEASIDASEYRNFLIEEVRPYSPAKYATVSEHPYMVGALARFNLNGEQLNLMGRQAADYLGLQRPCNNPFLNTVAQVVEWGHCLEESISLVEKIISDGINEEAVLRRMFPKRDQWPIQTKAGSGVGAVEVPRGLLIHDYTVNNGGIITDANCIIPTNQNINNLEADMKKIIPEIIETQNAEQITQTLEMLARAYDPCISCSTHILNVTFI
ncbi:MAG: Ni/Fe hydrogenase subunit alpha [Nitrospirota bacterium]